MKWVFFPSSYIEINSSSPSSSLNLESLRALTEIEPLKNCLKHFSIWVFFYFCCCCFCTHTSFCLWQLLRYCLLPLTLLLIAACTCCCFTSSASSTSSCFSISYFCCSFCRHVTLSQVFCRRPLTVSTVSFIRWLLNCSPLTSPLSPTFFL